MGIQLGIIGYGGMGGFHHRNASKIEGVQVVGTYDIDPVRVQAAEKNGIKGFSTLEDLLSCDEINTVLVAVPNDKHMELCVEATNAGKHVICEKPAAMNVRELDQMIAAAGRNGKIFTVHQNRRWDKDFRIVKKIWIPANWERYTRFNPGFMVPGALCSVGAEKKSTAAVCFMIGECIL